MNWQETPHHAELKLGPGDLREFTEALDQAQQSLFALVYSGALNIDPTLKEIHPDYIDRWLVHGENHAMFGGLYVHMFGAPGSGRKTSPLLYIKGGYEHDLAKVEIPPELWDKPRAHLTPEEQYAKWSHVLLGEAVFDRYEQLSGKRISRIEKWALSQHHERLDGTGGPRGLKGEQISPVGRLFAVMDQIFSRVEGRPDSDPMTLNQAVADVRRHPQRYDAEIAKRVEVLFSSNVHMQIPSLRLSLGQWDGTYEVL